MKAYDVKTLRPCRSGGRIVEGHFSNEFAMHELCSLLHGSNTKILAKQDE